LRNLQAQFSSKSVADKTIMLSELELPVAEEAKRPELGIADVIGNCKIVKKLGAGAFGVVYLARHKVLDIDVAIKLLPIEAAHRDPGFVDLFLREARTAARIRHRNVIGIFEAGVQDGQHYIIMELASGGTVAERMFVNGGKLPASEAEQILLQAARGLEAAEKLKIIHRDIKPDNLMFASDGEVKIADLGLAKRLIPAGATGTIRASLAADQLSIKGDNQMLAGTPAYMAPEIAVEPEKADTRADLYSLGVTAYQMLTGKLPFEGKTTVEVIMKHVLDAPTPVHEIDRSIPADLSKIIMKLMEKKPENRYQSATEVVKALEYRNIAEGLMATF
jgi:serine/threonine-protein kinase